MVLPLGFSFTQSHVPSTTKNAITGQRKTPLLPWHPPPCPGEGSRGLRPFSPISQAGQVWGLTPNGVQAGAEPPMPHSAGQGEWGEGRRAEGSSSTDLTALGSETGACRACPCSPCCCCSTSHRLGWGVGAATTPRRLSLAPAPMSSLTEGSHNCPVSVPLGPQAVQWLYSCRTQPFLCPFLAVVQIAYIWRVLCWPFSSQAGNAGAWLPVPSSCPWSNHTSSAFGCGWCQG